MLLKRIRYYPGLVLKAVGWRRRAIHNGLTVLPATHKYWHGEKVAFGTLAMLMLTDRAPELIEEVYQFCEDIGLPTTLADIGLAGVSDDELLAVAGPLVKLETIHNEPFTITPEAVQAALRAADAVGQARKRSILQVNVSL